GDLANFNKAAQELLKVVAGEPFSSKPEDMLKAIREAMAGSANIIGIEAAQDNMEPILTKYLGMMEEHPGNFWKKQLGWSAVQHTFRHPTSRAQEILGTVDGPSLNEDGMFELVEKALHMGAYRREVRDKATGKLKFKSTVVIAEKKFKLGWPNRLVWAKIRDYGPFFFMAFFIQFFKDIFKDSFSGK
ncbi:MAG: hypothetical protein Q8O68_00855, partial [Candidatus Daviesbacteria bacterium]|nr:hypothetical protein [Candidatus Daviesbacteria bacterium]